MKIKYLILCFVLMAGATASAQSFYDVTAFGAKSNSGEKATEAIRKAIEAASAAGGGTVFFPAGEYLTGPMYLKSNITLYLDAGAYVRFSDDFDDYLPFVQSRYEGIMVKSFTPLIYAYEEENIAITGRGTLDGQGKKWWDTTERLQGKDAQRVKWQDLHDEANKETITENSPHMIKRGFLRPPFIQPMFCENVRIEGVTIVNSPFWTVTPEFCENVTITGVTINNPLSPNTDGINPSSCRYVHISDCHISVGDDCITIKSGKDEDGRRMATAAENYTITNCTMLAGHGGVVIGSEMSGDVKKITISNCVFDGTDRGIRIKSTRGRGGVVEDIRVDNVIMKNIKKEAIKLNMFYTQTPEEPVSERTPVFRNIHFSDITAQGNQAVVLIGLPELPIENITFSNINFDCKDGIAITDGKHIELHHVEVNTELGSAVEVVNTTDLEIVDLKTYTAHAAKPVISLNQVKNALLTANRAMTGTDVYLQVSGDQSEEIYFMGNFMHAAKEPVKLMESASKKAVIKK